MIERTPAIKRPRGTPAMGSLLVAVGLVLFLVVFLTMLPILTDPTGAYERWFPAAVIDLTPDTTTTTTVTPPSETTTVPGMADPSDVLDELDLQLDLESALEDAVGNVGSDITATIDSALTGISATFRGGVAVALFAMAALAVTLVAWRISRIGVMLLTHDPREARTAEPSAAQFVIQVPAVEQTPQVQHEVEPV